MTSFWFAFAGTLVLLCAVGSAFLITYLIVVMICGVFDRRRERRNFISDFEAKRYRITPALPFDWKTRSRNGRR